MALTKETTIDKIEIVGPFKMIQVREAEVIKEDGVEIARKFHRRCLCPTDDMSNEDAEVQAVSNAVHTQEVKDAYSARLA